MPPNLLVQIAIKNMVCPRCIDAVERIAGSAGLVLHEIKLGEITIESTAHKMLLDCFNQQRMEKIKELLVYDQLNISEIADHLDYSSPAHLSAQFKRETGMSPSEFKELRNPVRKSLDSV